MLREDLIGAHYNMLNNTSCAPEPDFFATVLWHRVVGTLVLAPNITVPANVSVFARDARNASHATVYILVNLDDTKTASLEIPGTSSSSRLYLLQSASWAAAEPRKRLQAHTMLLNGQPLALVGNQLPPLAGVPLSSPLSLPPLSAALLEL